MTILYCRIIPKSSNYASSALFLAKIDENYASPIFQSVLENAGDTMMHNSLNPLPYFPYMYYPGQGKNWG